MKPIPPAARSRCTDAKVAYGFEGIGKVGRPSRFGQNLPQTCLSVFSPKRLGRPTLPMPATRLKRHPATETSD
ncbi:hypothetical protein K0F27_14120 [Bacteroides caccae]|uniref:hypothetical protein n=1 Tax=Bacteroides caccae TaxID=47678 RepID=UPI001F30A740|nr:hypothetical protein [Bacteroides caccae]MCE8770305.1 hypothetical protein [Bacteroides caccae]